MKWLPKQQQTKTRARWQWTQKRAVCIGCSIIDNGGATTQRRSDNIREHITRGTGSWFWRKPRQDTQKSVEWINSVAFSPQQRCDQFCSLKQRESGAVILINNSGAARVSLSTNLSNRARGKVRRRTKFTAPQILLGALLA